MAKQANKPLLKKFILFLVAIGIAIPITLLLMTYVFPKADVLEAQENLYNHYNNSEVQEFDDSLTTALNFFEGLEYSSSESSTEYDINNYNLICYYESLYVNFKSFHELSIEKSFNVKDMNDYSKKLSDLKKKDNILKEKMNTLDNYLDTQIRVYKNLDNQTPAITKSYYNNFISKLEVYQKAYGDYLNVTLSIVNDCTESKISDNKLEKAYREIYFTYIDSVNSYLINSESKVIENKIIDNYESFIDKDYLNSEKANLYYSDNEKANKIISAANSSKMNEYIENFINGTEEEYIGKCEDDEKVILENLNKILLGLEV